MWLRTRDSKSEDIHGQYDTLTMCKFKVEIQFYYTSKWNLERIPFVFEPRIAKMSSNTVNNDNSINNKT